MSNSLAIMMNGTLHPATSFIAAQISIASAMIADAPAWRWVNVASDIGIGLAFMTIPVILAVLLRRRPDVPFAWLFWLFSVFMVACGLTHLMQAAALWWPVYGATGIVAMTTAVLAWIAVVGLIPVVTRVLALRTPQDLQREIDERDRAERRFRGFLESAPDGRVIMDSDGRIALTNRQIERMFEIDRGELIGRPVGRLFNTTDSIGIEARVRQAAESQSRVRIEAQAIKGAGGEFTAELVCSELDTDKGTEVSISIRDITRRKQIERRLRNAADEIAMKNRDLQTLLYVTSHDLREPLRAIRNFSSMVSNDYAQQLDARGQDLLRRVVRGGQRMDQLINDVLNLSRAQRMESDRTRVDGRKLVDSAIVSLQEQITQTGATVEIAPDLPTLSVQPRWAEQAVFNLIANALKFKRDDEPPHILVRGYHGNEEVGLVVCDRGPGVDPDNTERIFSLFQRAVGRDVPGTGAGLAIVRQVAERHGGRAWCQPRDGGGTEFFMTFSSFPKESAGEQLSDH